MIECPMCHGEGKRIVFACPGFRALEIGCEMCKGEGEISEAQIAWVEVGALCKERRRKLQLIVRDAEIVTGIMAADICRMEAGICDPSPLVAALAQLPVQAQDGPHA